MQICRRDIAGRPQFHAITLIGNEFPLRKCHWTLTLSNTGANAASGLGYAFANPAGAVVRGSYGFSPGAAGWGTCPAAGGSLAAGASCTVIVKYAADCTGGSNNGTLSITGANFTTLAIPVTAATKSTGTCG